MGLTFQSDVSTLEAAIEMLSEQLSQQAAALSSDGNLFRSRVQRSHKQRERRPKLHYRDSNAASQHGDRPWIEQPIREVSLRSRRQHRRGSGRSSSKDGSISLFGALTAPPSDEEKRAIVNRLIAGLAAAAEAAGFDVEGAES